MQVFKACLKVIRRNMPSMLIYVFIFLFFILLLTVFYQPVESTLFETTRNRIAIIQDDSDHPFSAGLVNFLDQHAILVDLPADEQVLQDALFHRDVTYILRIPAGFGEAFLDGTQRLELQRTLLPDSHSGVMLDLLVSRYLNLAALYSDSLPEMSLPLLQAAVVHDIQQSSRVEMIETTNNGEYKRSTYFFNYLAYTLLAVLILSICSIMLVFNQIDIRRRNHCSPVRLISFNIQMVLGNLVFALLLWLAMIMLGWFLGGSQIRPAEFALLSLNALIFTFACLSLSFLVSQFVRSRAVMQSVANVLALGTSFISGVFVPIDFLGSSVQFAASFTPTYWYIKAIRDIDRLADFSRQSLQPIAGYMLIQLGFVVVMLVVGLAVVKQKRQAIQ